MTLGTCQLCERENIETTDHHLIPVTRHSNKKTKKETDRDTRNIKVPLCKPCHKQIHKLITEKEMERHYNTIEKLKEHSGVQKFIAWVRTKTF
jgi:hypothetical protein